MSVEVREPGDDTPFGHLCEDARDSPPSRIVVNRSFDGMNLSRRALLGVRFENCTFRECKFVDSDLSFTRFDNCDLYLADFTGAVLYSCDFTASVLTRAIFTDALLYGARLREVEVTETEFGRGKSVEEQLPVGKNRSSRRWGDDLEPSLTRLKLGELIEAAREFEEHNAGIAVAGFDVVAMFDAGKTFKDHERETRDARDRSEIARTLKRVHMEAGYVDRALEYYHLERLWERRGMPLGLRRTLNWMLRERIWGYGVGWGRAAATLALSVAGFAALYVLLSSISESSGLRIPDGGMAGIDTNLATSLDHVGLALYYAATFPIAGPGDVSAVGWARLVAVVETVWVIVVVALLVAAVARRSANL